MRIPKVVSFFWELKNRFLWSLGGKTLGARVLVIKKPIHEVLLVRHTYSDGWHTIGGGIDQGEGPLAAIQRELWEEAGLRTKNVPQLFGFYYNHQHGKQDYVALYTIELNNDEEYSLQRDKDHNKHNFEIEEIRWFSLANLPEDITPATRRRIDEFLGRASISEHW